MISHIISLLKMVIFTNLQTVKSVKLPEATILVSTMKSPQSSAPVD